MEERERTKEEVLVRLFAPQVRLSSNDPWNPASVEWFVQRSELCFDERVAMWAPFSMWQREATSIIDESPTTHNLHLHKHQFKGDVFSSGGNEPSEQSSRFFLRLTSPSFYAGSSPDDLSEGKVPVYAHVIYHEEYVAIQYFFFYAFNGNIVDWLPSVGIHEGDWEHTTVRLHREALSFIPASYPAQEWQMASMEELRGFIISIFFARHGQEGKWYFQPTNEHSLDDSGYLLVEGTAHHVVYSAKGGHASYTKSCSRHRRFVPRGLPLLLFDDYTDALGIVWNTWDNVVLLQGDDPSQLWLHFAGQWGAKSRSILSTNGPYGPLLKHYFASGDSDPTPFNSTQMGSPSPSPCSEHLGFWMRIGLTIGIIGLLFAGLASVLLWVFPDKAD